MDNAPQPRISATVNIVFDIGNVLLEWNPSALAHQYFAHGLPGHLTPEGFASAMVNTDWIAYDNGDHDLQSLAHALAPKLGCDEHLLRAFIEKIPSVLPVLPDALDVLETLFDRRDEGQALRVFFLSNMPSEFADVLERRFRWFARFDGGVFSARVRLSKPHAEIYERLVADNALAGQRIVFLDDSRPNIDAARALGWETVHIQARSDVRLGLGALGILKSLAG